MSTKRISVNPDFFNIGRKKTKKKLSHSLRTNFNSLQKNMLKDKMINKIKEFKKKQRKKSKKENSENNEEFSNNYKEAVDFMEDVIKKKTRKNRRKKKKLENNAVNQSVLNVKTEPDSLKITTNNIENIVENIIENKIKSDPPYGILKNGKKTLYSKYRKSLKNNQNTQNDPLLTIRPHTTSKVNNKQIIAFTDEKEFGKELVIPSNTQSTALVKYDDKNIVRKDKLESLKENFMDKNKKNKKNKNEKFKVKNKKIMKRFILGKNAKTRKVSVLINNKKTRRLINKDCNFLKKKKLKQIKSVLVNNALIKVGTQAPEKLLREMYINRYLAGDVSNSGGKNAEEILMHNWNRDTS